MNNWAGSDHTQIATSGIRGGNDLLLGHVVHPAMEILPEIVQELTLEHEIVKVAATSWENPRR